LHAGSGGNTALDVIHLSGWNERPFLAAKYKLLLVKFSLCGRLALQWCCVKVR